MDEKITIDDVLDLISNKAQWCREEGDPDMRYIIHMVDGIRSKIKNGKSREEILEDYT